MKVINLNFKIYKVVLFFIFTFFLFVLAVLGLINNVIITIIPLLIFIGPCAIFTLNFIHLFKKQTPLVITENEISYSVIKLDIKMNDIKYISLCYSKSLLLEIHLNNFEKYKDELKQTLIGRILLLNYKFMGKNSIFINVSLFDIRNDELSENLKKIIPKNKIFFS